jgi:drug/metabolite transporter (DMT)-like permease
MSQVTEPPASARALISLHLAVALFGFAGLFGKWVALPPVEIVFGRAVVASTALAVLLRSQRQTGALAASVDWRLAVSGAVLALHWVAFFEAIQIASVSVGLLGFASFPLFVLLIEAATGQRRVHRRDGIVAALVSAGLLLLVPEFRWANRIVHGLAWGILSGFTFALLAVANRALTERYRADTIALWQNACAAACLFPLAFVTFTVPSAREVALLVVLGVVCTALSHTLFIGSLRTVSAHVASVVAALEPVYGIVLAFLLLGETLETRAVVGAVLLVAGALWATLERTFGGRNAFR